MLYYVTHENHAYTIKRLLKGANGALGFLHPISYERIFYDRSVPPGHYIFTDFDRLTPYEIEIACAVANALRNHSSEIQIFNDPRYSLERYPLLRRLEEAGINNFSVTRLDAGDLPPKYPVFIRSEDDCRKPDTDLIHTPEELTETLDKLRLNGRSLKRRIAVEFSAQRDGDGYFRKYGVFKIGDSLVPQHILRNDHWLVKNRQSGWDEAFIHEELSFIRDNPHQESLRLIFKIAEIDFGRIDYTLIDDTIQVFEINTNPSFPRLNKDSDGRGERREMLGKNLINALERLNTPHPKGKKIRFSIPKPYFHRLRRPKRTLIPSSVRRLLSRL
jgi:hypothetical protein